MNQTPREQLVEKLLFSMRQFLRQEQYQKLSDSFNEMPEDEFNQMMAEIVYVFKNGMQPSAKECEKWLKEMKRLNHVTADNSALNDCYVTYFPEEDNRKLWEEADCSAPSDHVCLKGEDDKALRNLWRQSVKDNEGIPSDLFFAGNIPLPDCLITVDERDTNKVDGQLITYRVVIFEDYMKRIDLAGDGRTMVGAIIFGEAGRKVLIPLMVCRGIDTIMLGTGIGWNGIPLKQREYAQTHVSLQDLASEVSVNLATWYGIQIALLHPTVKEVFRHPQKELVYDPKSSKVRNQKRITRYIKRHTIKAQDIESAEYKTDRSFTRHTLVWYVIGHWRNYSDGRKVFIQPYWKGALRDMKRNLDEREREIVIGGAEA